MDGQFILIRVIFGQTGVGLHGRMVQAAKFVVDGDDHAGLLVGLVLAHGEGPLIHHGIFARLAVFARQGIVKIHGEGQLLIGHLYQSGGPPGRLLVLGGHHSHPVADEADIALEHALLRGQGLGLLELGAVVVEAVLRGVEGVEHGVDSLHSQGRRVINGGDIAVGDGAEHHGQVSHILQIHVAGKAQTSRGFSPGIMNGLRCSDQLHNRFLLPWKARFSASFLCLQIR